MEAYPLPPYCTLVATALAAPAVAVVLCLVVVPVFAALVVAPAALVVAVVTIATPVVVFDFPADVASVVAAAFHSASVVGVDAIASAPMGLSTREERFQIFAPYSLPSAII